MKNIDKAKKILNSTKLKLGYGYQYLPVVVRVLNKEFRSLRVKFHLVTKEQIGKLHYVIMSGQYTPPELREDSDSPIYEVFILRSKSVNRIRLGKWFYDDIFFTISHELRHGYQYSARKFRKRKQPYSKKYQFKIKVDLTEQDLNLIYQLIDYDEIDAHAYDTFQRMKEKKLTIKQILDLGHAEWYNTIIKQHFPHVWKRFVKKLYQLSHK